MKKIITIIIVFFILIKPTYSNNEKIEILLKVNENIISNIDIINEAKYLKILNKNLQSIEKQQIFKIAKNSLIREIIKKDEIEKFYEIDFESNSVDIYIDKLFQNLGFNNKIEFENYLTKNGIKISNIKKKLIIEKTWNNLIYEIYKDKIKIDEKRILNDLDNLAKKETYQETFKISEIVFIEKNKTLFEKKYKEILNDIKKLGFKNAAIIHSISDTSRMGGEVGWVKKNEISKKIYDKIKNLKNEEITEPITTPGGSLILQVNGTKNILVEEMNKELEFSRIINMEKNKQLNEYSIIYYKKVENNSYVENL